MITKNILKPKEGQFRIQAFCSKCKKLLQESNPMTKKGVISLWDRTVLGAVNITCPDCGTKFPNFDIDLKIFNTVRKRTYEPSDYIKIPKRNRQTPDELFKSVANKWLKEHPGIEEPNPQEVAQEVNQEQSKHIELESNIKRVTELRQKCYGEKPTDTSAPDGVIQPD